ncbi:hypothetical protein B9Z19DRAFT_1172710 [Tuber borchii]|uniref:Uncharacterized protein n=1 Tax=Tuber borchii TaxID=42251 RepID=A0A2T7A7S7_TUBBO|nr:hypothetical protein B9Z19DRAFT_1172710 [Tuber borchii]
MPPHQTILNRFDTPQTSRDTGSTNESFTIGAKERPVKPFSSDSQPHRNLIALIWRFLLTFFSLVLLAISLWQFSKSQSLSKWEQRWFNMLSILFSGSGSLGLGSLLGYLGSMLRWPLLAQTMYKMQDVDSILGMSPPAGSLRLIKRHIRERISRTTFIVTAYLVTNVLGRLSVAIFGLAYNMMDKTGIEYPILATNWTSVSWAGNADTTTNQAVGLGQEATEGKDTTSIIIMLDNSSYSLSGLEISNSTLQVGTSAVNYSYQLKDFQEGYTILSNRTVHSTVKCTLIEVKQGKYWRWNNWNRTGPFNWGKGNDPKDVLSGVLSASNTSRSESLATDKRSVFPQEWVSPISLLDEEPKTSQIYIVCDKLAWECSPILTETTTRESHQIQLHERFFHPTKLYGLLGLGLDLGSNVYDGSVDNYLFYVDQPSTRAFSPNALDGLGRICLQNFTMPLNKTQWNSYTLWVSGLVARLPIVAIQHANTALPRYTRDTHSNQTAGTVYLHTTLEVNWNRVILIAVSITVGQILAILAVLYYCNGVYTRDDSHLATAELLKTIINRFDGGKLMTGEELAVSLDRALGASVSYGTRKGQDGGPPKVDLACGLNSDFPPFPRKGQFERKHTLKKR